MEVTFVVTALIFNVQLGVSSVIRNRAKYYLQLTVSFEFHHVILSWSPKLDMCLSLPKHVWCTITSQRDKHHLLD